MTTLEAIEQRTGRVHTTHDHGLVCEKAATRPADLSDEDLAVLEFFGGTRHAVEARAKRDRARRPSVDPSKPVAAAPAVETVHVRDGETIADFCTRAGDVPVTMDVLGVLWKFVERINDKNKERNARLDALEKRLAALESRGPSVEYKGVFTLGMTYPRGSLTTRDGGLWLALEDTTLQPGKGTSTWRLVVKSGHA